jgi:ceramide glucosyltransferase
MLLLLHRIVTGILLAASVGGIVYLAAAVAAVVAFSRRRYSGSPEAPLPPLTVLKPVCGGDHDLYENLRSFCAQSYPEFQVVFGVADPGDPAIPVILRVIAEFPERDAALVLGPGGTEPEGNRKVANLARMFRRARHDLLVVADSDMRVGPDYLERAASPFADPRVGAATCLYSGSAARGLSSQLGALFINDWFLPSVLVALLLQPLRFCFGATMAVRRDALDAIGGFAALTPYLADDYMLGALVAERGYDVRLSPYVVEGIVSEPGLGSLLTHELRWARTVRASRPAGYAFSVVGNGAITIAALAALAVGLSGTGIALLSLAIALRLALHAAVRGAVRVPGPCVPWLIPLRDLLCVAIWAASFSGRGVRWRGRSFSVDRDGRVKASGACDRREKDAVP